MLGFLRKRLSEAKDSVVKKLTERELTSELFDELFEPLELSLLESNVALSVVESIKDSLFNELVGHSFKRKELISVINSSLRRAISDLLIEGDVKLFLNGLRSHKPASIMLVGSNGSGKTTTIAKLAYYLKRNGFSCVLSASDTFRAASIEQLRVHADALGLRVISHQYGSDAAAVAFDALRHAEAQGIDVVLIDTAGRSHSNINLMRELSKLKRVINPLFTIFVGDSLTGNEVVNQCRDFSQAVNGFDFIILTKSDVDERGGAILSVSKESGVPILFLGTGQGYKDLVPFKKEELLNKLFSDSKTK